MINVKLGYTSQQHFMTVEGQSEQESNTCTSLECKLSRDVCKVDGSQLRDGQLLNVFRVDVKVNLICSLKAVCLWFYQISYRFSDLGNYQAICRKTAISVNV